MKRFATNFLALVGAIFVAFVGIATIFPEAWAQVDPRRPQFAANTHVTDLTVDEQANIFELTIGSGGCSGCGGEAAGMQGELQYNEAGALGAVPMVYDPMAQTLVFTGMSEVSLDADLGLISADLGLFAAMRSTGLQDFANDAAACVGGLIEGDYYHNAGAMRVVLMC